MEIHRGSEFKNWKSQWEAFVRLSKLDQADPQTQVDILTLACSEGTWKKIQNMGLTSAQMKSVPDILKAVDKYAQGQVNEVMESRNFHLRVQEPGESFYDFLTSLRDLASTCNFCDCSHDRLKRDRIVCGLLDGETIKKLLTHSTLTLKQAEEICLVEESASKDRDAIMKPASLKLKKTVSQSCARRGEKKGIPRPNQASGYAKEKTPKCKNCFRCGRPTHKGNELCPAKESTCNLCGKRGHFRIVCKSAIAAKPYTSRPLNTKKIKFLVVLLQQLKSNMRQELKLKLNTVVNH